MIHPELKPITKPYGKNRVILIQDFIYRCPKTQITTVTLAGFISDGMSWSRLFLSVLGGRFSPVNIGPSFSHDNPYRFGVDINGKKITRKQADTIIIQALKLNGVGWTMRKLIYSGLRTGGWLAWKRHRRKNLKQ